MFIGHYATALVAKRIAPKAGLGTLVFAVMWPDLLWPFLLIGGVEEVAVVPGLTAATPLAFLSYPLSHSLVLDVGWGMLLGSLVWFCLGDARAALITAVAVVSHWVLDWVTHRPDLPIFPGGDLHGLGLWHSIPGTIAVELLLLVGGVALYLRTTRARDGIWLASIFGPPPPSPAIVAWSALALWLLVPWAAWIERRRRIAGPGAADVD
jgi:hypothetical protein